MSRDWNAASYDTISAPQQEWGAAVIERLHLHGDEVVLDAGAGTGRVTEMVLQRLPRGHVIAVDGSRSMCDLAAQRLPADRVTVICSDLLDLRLDTHVDAIVSTATFHWVLDHAALFARIRDALRPGGEFVAQCGGAGNIDRVRGIGDAIAAQPPFAPHLATMAAVWNYATVEATRERLHAAGFDVSACWLQAAPATPPRPREFLQTVVFAPHLDRLPPELRDAYLDSIMAALGEPVVLDYVRLNWDATAR